MVMGEMRVNRAMKTSVSQHGANRVEEERDDKLTRCCVLAEAVVIDRTVQCLERGFVLVLIYRALFGESPDNCWRSTTRDSTRQSP